MRSLIKICTFSAVEFVLRLGPDVSVVECNLQPERYLFELELDEFFDMILCIDSILYGAG